MWSSSRGGRGRAQRSLFHEPPPKQPARARARGGSGGPPPPQPQQLSKEASGVGVVKGAPPKVFAFVDHSNINIMAQRVSGQDRNFHEGTTDLCLRVVPAKVSDFLTARHKHQTGSTVEDLFYFTSDKSVLSVDNTQGRNIRPKLFWRSGFTHKEKYVDTYMVADAVVTIFQHKEPGILSLWSGDKDILLPVIEKALSKENWTIEVFSFKDALTPLHEKFPQVSFFPLDPVYKEISERKTGWSPNETLTPPPHSSFRIQFGRGTQEMVVVKSSWRRIVDELSFKIRLPLFVWINWREAAMHVILSAPNKDISRYMWAVYENRVELQNTVRHFMERLQVPSNCAILIRVTCEAVTVGEGNLNRSLQRLEPRHPHSSSYEAS